jgi:hypothetical protein
MDKSRKWEAKQTDDGWLVQEAGGDPESAVLFRGLDTEEMRELARVIVAAVKPIDHLFRTKTDT